MRNIIKYTLGFIASITIFSCNDFLEVEPEDKLLETQVYASEINTQNVLNGVYLRLAENNSYGGSLTMSTVEVLGQRYYGRHQNSIWRDLSEFKYTSASVKSSFDAIWRSCYKSILNLNVLIEQIDEYNTIPVPKANILKGEAYGLRAMLHFDMLRLFGPVYSTNPDGESIPYYIKGEAKGQNLLTASAVIDKILLDLETAETLLSEDDIIDNAVQEYIEDSFYKSRRNIRFNYYAVKALQARVHLYAGNVVEAHTAAKFVIDNAGSRFPWTDPSDIISAGQSPDRIFSSENIFALFNTELYERQARLFHSSLSRSTILAPLSSRLKKVFDDNENDYRYNSSWIQDPFGEHNFRTFFKFVDVGDESFRFMQPLIKMSEMYLIAAETETDPTIALQYLNTLRFNRGLIDLTPVEDINVPLRQEYQKEFFGEGQLFFYYKRKNFDKIPNGSSSWFNLLMNDTKYVVPLPDSEIQFQ